MAILGRLQPIVTVVNWSKPSYKSNQELVYYGAERTIQDWNKHGIAHIITYRNSPKPPR